MDGLYESFDRSKNTELKFCPMIRETCRGAECQWWVLDFVEDKQTYRADCAVTLAAKGLTDESLLRLARR